MKISRIDPVWKWRADAHATIKLDALKGICAGLHVLRGKGDVLYALIKRGEIQIFPGYAIDGATFAPDFRRGLRGFFVHDALLQLLDKFPCLFPEQVAHDAMLEVHTADKFRLRKLYHYGVSEWPRKLYKRFAK